MALILMDLEEIYQRFISWLNKAGSFFGKLSLIEKKNRLNITFKGVEAFKDQPIGTHFG
jgi:hypothetical protein